MVGLIYIIVRYFNLERAYKAINVFPYPGLASMITLFLLFKIALIKTDLISPWFMFRG